MQRERRRMTWAGKGEKASPKVKNVPQGGATSCRFKSFRKKKDGENFKGMLKEKKLHSRGRTIEKKLLEGRKKGKKSISLRVLVIGRGDYEPCDARSVSLKTARLTHQGGGRER